MNLKKAKEKDGFFAIMACVYCLTSAIAAQAHIQATTNININI